MERRHCLIEDEVKLKVISASAGRRRLVELEFLIPKPIASAELYVPKQLYRHQRVGFHGDDSCSWRLQERWTLSSGSPAVVAEGKAGDVFELRRRKESPPPISYSTSSRMPLP